MQWGSVENFIHMGGYGFYVWASYGTCALVVAAEVMATRARLRRARDGVAQGIGATPAGGSAAA